MGEIFSQAPMLEHEAFMAAYQRLLPRLQRFEAVRTFRGDLAQDLKGLVRHGFLEDKALAFSTGNSPRNIAFDVLRFANYMDQYANVLKGRVWVTPEQLNAGRAAAKRLLEIAGEKEYAPEDETEHKSSRHRALTYVVRLYEEIRAAVLYARRAHGDGDILAPSLYATRGRRSPGREPAPATPAPGNPSPAGDPPSPTGDAADGTVDGVDLAHLVALMNGSVPNVTPSAPAAAESTLGEKAKLA